MSWLFIRIPVQVKKKKKKKCCLASHGNKLWSSILSVVHQRNCFYKLPFSFYKTLWPTLLRVTGAICMIKNENARVLNTHEHTAANLGALAGLEVFSKCLTATLPLSLSLLTQQHPSGFTTLPLLNFWRTRRKEKKKTGSLHLNMQFSLFLWLLLFSYFVITCRGYSLLHFSPSLHSKSSSILTSFFIPSCF